MAVGVLLKVHMWQNGVWRFHESIEFQEGNRMYHVEVLGMLKKPQITGTCYSHGVDVEVLWAMLLLSKEWKYQEESEKSYRKL